MRYSVHFSIVLLLCTSLHAQTYQPTWESLDRRPVPQWFRDAKFGIFIHWGVYSVPGWSSKGQYAEWYQQGLNSGDTARIRYHKKKFGDLTYYQLADQFKAELYNPDEWAGLIEKSGAKYVVLTSRHHDGWSNWPSKETDKAWGFPWNSGEAGPHRDLLGDLFTAIRKTSVHPGMYYSLYEWYNPIWLKDRARYVSDYMWPQMKDLINTYQPDVFWTDGDWDASDTVWKSPQFLAWLYNESPVKDRIVTYDRWGAGIRFHHGGVYTPEYQPNVSFDDHYWEESRGMGFSYGYNREEDSWDYNSTKDLIGMLIDKVSRGGNFLLDIGPDEHGKIPPIMEERLLQIGDWMKINGEAIYNTVRWRTPSQGDCSFTYNPTTNNLYVLLSRWPALTAGSSSGVSSFTIHDLSLSADAQVELLETHQPLTVHQQGKDLVVDLPPFDPGKIKSQYAYVISLHHTGAFAARPVVQVSYPGKGLHPLVSIRGGEGVTYHYTLDGSEPSPSSPVCTTAMTIEKTALLRVRGFKEGVLPGQEISMPLQVYDWHAAVKPGKIQPGLYFSIYEWPDGAVSSSVDQLDKLPVAGGGAPAHITASGLPRKEHAGLIYNGYLKVPSDGVYSFYLASDDGSRLWLDGQVAVDNDGLHGSEFKSGKVYLKKGFHAVRLAWFNNTGSADLQLKYSIDGGKRLDIPEEWFFHTEK